MSMISTPSGATPTPTTFLTLAFEVRNMIYTFVFAGSRIDIHVTDMVDGKYCLAGRTPYWCLLRACCHIHKEATEVAYAHLIVHICNPRCNPRVRPLEEEETLQEGWLEGLPELLRQQARTVEVSVDSSYLLFTPALRTIFPKLETLVEYQATHERPDGLMSGWAGALVKDAEDRGYCMLDPRVYAMVIRTEMFPHIFFAEGDNRAIVNCPALCPINTVADLFWAPTSTSSTRRSRCSSLLSAAPHVVNA